MLIGTARYVCTPSLQAARGWRGHPGPRAAGGSPHRQSTAFMLWPRGGAVAGGAGGYITGGTESFFGRPYVGACGVYDAPLPLYGCSQARVGCLHKQRPSSIQPPAWQHVWSVATRHEEKVLYVAAQWASVQLSQGVGLNVQHCARISGAAAQLLPPLLDTSQVCGKPPGPSRAACQ